MPDVCTIWGLFPNRPTYNTMANSTFVKKRLLWRLTVLLSLGGILSIWASNIDFASPPLTPQRPAPPAPVEREKDRASQILHGALLSTERVFFSGEQTILTFNEDDGVACVTEETHLGPNRFRIAYQNPPNVRGRLQIAEAGWFHHYLPNTNTLIKRRMPSTSLTEAEVASRLARIRQNYRLVLAARPENMAERPAYLLDILPRTQGRPRQKLWIDTRTGLVLRRETYSPAGAQTSVTSWRNLKFYASPAEEALHWTPPPGTRTEEEAGTQALSLVETRAKAASWAVIPDKLGGDFSFESARFVNARGAQGLDCTYSDGLCTLSLIQLAGTQSFRTASGTIKPLPLASYSVENAQITTQGSVNVLSWSSPQGNATLSLLGELTEETLIGLAKSLP